MIIVPANNTKTLKKALLVLLCSIDASLKYIIDNDLASGFHILRDNANNILCRVKPDAPLTLGHLIEQRTAIIALNKIINEYTAMHKPCNEMIELHNSILADHHKEEIEEPESRKKIPAILTTTSRIHLGPGLG